MCEFGEEDVISIQGYEVGRNSFHTFFSCPMVYISLNLIYLYVD